MRIAAVQHDIVWEDRAANVARLAPQIARAAAAGAELVLRLAGRWVRWPSDARWFAVGLLAPLIVWGAVLIAATRTVGVGWNVHMVSGLLTLVARRVQPGPVPADEGYAAPAVTEDESRTGVPAS